MQWGVAMTEELKPCPFCGGDAKNLGDDERFMIGCDNASCVVQPNTSMHFDPLHAQGEWNTRPSPWVSVKDLLPAARPKVLARWEGSLIRVDCASSAEVGRYGAHVCNDGGPHITHWMPLPDHPEAKP